MFGRTLLLFIPLVTVSCSDTPLSEQETSHQPINGKSNYAVSEPKQEAKFDCLAKSTSEDQKKKKGIPPPPEPVPYPPYDPIEPDPIYYIDPPAPVIEEYLEEYPARSTQDSVVSIAEVMPEFPGGVEELMNYIKKNLRYPEDAKEMEVQGKVYIRFAVYKDGSIGQLQLMRGISSSCDKEAMKVVREMPKWKPATQNGKPINCYMTIPVKFQLN